MKPCRIWNYNGPECTCCRLLSFYYRPVVPGKALWCLPSLRFAFASPEAFLCSRRATSKGPHLNTGPSWLKPSVENCILALRFFEARMISSEFPYFVFIAFTHFSPAANNSRRCFSDISCSPKAMAFEKGKITPIRLNASNFVYLCKFNLLTNRRFHEKKNFIPIESYHDWGPNFVSTHRKQCRKSTIEQLEHRFPHRIRSFVDTALLSACWANWESHQIL